MSGFGGGERILSRHRPPDMGFSELSYGQWGLERSELCFYTWEPGNRLSGRRRSSKAQQVN